jgi:signal transduction histidine kinase
MLIGSLRTRLLALALLLVIPSFFFLVVSNFKRQSSEKSRARERAITIAKLAAANESYYVRLAHQELATLTQIPVTLAPDRAALEGGLKTVRALLPDFDDFGIVETNGVPFAHTLGANVTDPFSRALLEKVMATREFSVGVFHRDSSSNKPCLQFAAPIFGSNHVVGRIMYASLKTELFGQALTNISLPEGGALTVFDREGNILARRPQSQKWVGQRLDTHPFIQQAINHGSDVFESSGLDGVERLYAVSEVSDRANRILYITVGIPRREVFAAADRELAVSLILITILAALLLALGWWYSERQFIRPTSAIIQAADRISEGDLAARVALPRGKSELHRIAERFDQMAANLERRQAELEKANVEIKSHAAQLEQRVAERTQELQALNSELEAFSYSVSHDLRAPLRHMNGFAQLLLKNPKLQEDAQIQRQLNVIMDAAKKMGTLIDDLLQFSRMGRQSLAFRDVDLNELVKEVVAEIVAREPDRKIEWHITLLPHVEGDLALLRQVWINLISNAVKYSREKNLAVIEIKSEDTPAEIIFSVKDNGAGFDMAYANKLFGVFQRLHHAEEFEGTGIGLANVRRIINRHGGRVWAEGKVGEGATFFFSIPKKAL